MKRMSNAFLALMLALLVTLPAAGGCGKDEVAGPHDDLTRGQALAVAQTVARSENYDGNSPMGYTLGLLAYFTGPMAKAAKPGTQSAARRPAQGGLLSDDKGTFEYTLQAFDAVGDTVAWESGDWDRVSRVVVTWLMRFDATEDSTDSYWRFHAKGAYDVDGLLASSDEMRFNGGARDTFAYRFNYGNAHWIGDGKSHTELQQLRLAHDLETRPYPLGGTVSYEVDQSWSYTDGATTGQDAVRADVAVQYDGTRYAIVIVDGVYRYRLDLETGVVSELST